MVDFSKLSDRDIIISIATTQEAILERLKKVEDVADEVREFPNFKKEVLGKLKDLDGRVVALEKNEACEEGIEEGRAAFWATYKDPILKLLYFFAGLAALLIWQTFCHIWGVVK